MKRPIYMRRVGSTLQCVSAMDQELLTSYGEGVDLEVNISRKRSLPQLRLYWSILGKVVEATDAYPTAEHLHDAIKLELGYVRPIRKIDGSLRFLPDSVALHEMEQPDFQVYFDRAMQLIAQTFGFDPLKDMEAA
jgi:hypothetical protein